MLQSVGEIGAAESTTGVDQCQQNADTKILSWPHGSSLTIYDYVYKSGKRIKELLNNCTKGAVNVIADAKMPRTKGRAAGRRVLAVFRDI